MSASPTPASSVPSNTRESRKEQRDRIFDSLPSLGSPEYLKLLETAPAAELPASVLARVYRQLHPSPAADATLERLLCHDERYGYLSILYTVARRRAARLDAYTPDDLVHDTIGEIVATLASPAGRYAEGAWTSYLHQCLDHAYRKLVGRRGERSMRRVEASVDGSDNRYDPIDAAATDTIPWHGRVAPDNAEWLEAFAEREAAAIPGERLRRVALDLIMDPTTPISSDDPDDVNTLTHRYGVDRFTIYRLRRQARAILRAALERQTEREIDMGCLTVARGTRLS